MKEDTVYLDQEKSRCLMKAYLELLKSQSHPVFLVIAGGPGAGKSTFFHARSSSFSIDRASALYHNPDELMMRLEEYQQALQDTHATAASAFMQWELPARHLAEDILEKAMDSRFHIIYDRSCALPCAKITIEKAKKLGFTIIFYGLYCDLSIAQARAVSREKAEGRHIPPSTIQERHRGFYQGLPSYFSIADQAFLYNGGIDGWPLIAEKSQHNNLTINDPHVFNLIWPSGCSVKAQDQEY